MTKKNNTNKDNKYCCMAQEKVIICSHYLRGHSGKANKINVELPQKAKRYQSHLLNFIWLRYRGIMCVLMKRISHCSFF